MAEKLTGKRGLGYKDHDKTAIRRRKTVRKDKRPASLELQTDLTSTETKLVVLDFLSAQPVERLTARNVPKDEKRNSPGKVRKSSSDASTHGSYRIRCAQLAKSARPLRKQYSLRLKKDLDEYLKQRGKSLDDLSSYGGVRDGGTLHQRAYTEGDTNMKRSPRQISPELKKGITGFNTSKLKHVEDEDKKPKELKQSKPHRPENLDIPFQRERIISPVLSPESQVAARLESISQEILDTYPDIFNEHISKISLHNLTYQKFASTARKLLEKYPGGWTRVALVCYFARELALEDESSDEQLEQLVEFSSKFISHTSAEWIASQGGWGALEEAGETLSPSLVRKKLREQPDLVDGILEDSPNKWLNWAKYYGVAALAIGMTVAYSMIR